MGLVQPASAVLYDYYNPGEHAGALWRLGVGAHVGHRRPGQGTVAGESCGPQDGTQTGGGVTCPNTPLLFSEYRCSVFYGAPTKSKLLSTLCSADVCQCAEGAPQAGGRAGGRAAWPGPASHLGL